MICSMLFCLASGAAFGAMAVFGKLAYAEGATASLVIASGGLVLVVAGGVGALDPLGATLGLAAAVLYATYILVSDELAARISPVALAALVCTGAALALTVSAGLLGELRPGERSPAGWGWIACLAAVSTVGAIGLFFAGLNRVGPTTASILATVEPLVTVALAVAVFGESLGGIQLVGGGLVLVAVLMVQT